MTRFPSFLSLLVATLILGSSFGVVHHVEGQDIDAADLAEAQRLLQSGNRLIERASRMHGERRTRMLRSGLADYMASLRIVRSRNTLFNAAIALELLADYEAAFNFLREYLEVPGLTDSDRAAALPKIVQLRDRVAVLRLRSEPAGASVWVDRRDLAPRGVCPFELAVAPGAHRIWVESPGFRSAEQTVEASLGETTDIALVLEARPITVQILAPSQHATRLDGAPIQPGTRLDVAPGTHLVTLTIAGVSPIERRFEVAAGSPPLVLDLTAAAAAALAERRETARLEVRSEVPARVEIDGFYAGTGSVVDATLPSGPHRIAVGADGYATLQVQHEFRDSDDLALDVELTAEAPGGWLMTWKAALATTASLALLSAGALSIWSWQSRERYDACAIGTSQCGELFDQVNTANLTTDLAWGLAASVGIAALVVLSIDDGPRETVSVGHFSAAGSPP